MRSITSGRTCALLVSACLAAGAAAVEEGQRAVVIAASGTAARRIGLPVPTATRYWADYGANAIRRSTIDGSLSAVLIPDLDGPYGVALDPATQQLVWTSAGDEAVQVAAVDGTSVLTLESSFEEDYAILVDEGGHKAVYGLKDNQIVKVTENPETGEGTLEVLMDLASPETLHGLALSPDHSVLYLGDEAGQMSRKLTLATHAVDSLVFEAAPIPIVADGPEQGSTR